MRDSERAFSSLIAREEEIRNQWHSLHESFLKRFTSVLPPNHELLLATPVFGPTAMSASFQLFNVLEYPRISSSSSGSASSDSSSTKPASLSKFPSSVPMPQNATEEEYCRLSSRALLAQVFQLKRELDTICRQRASWFQLGDAVLRSENEKLFVENEQLKKQIKEREKNKTSL